MTSEKLYVHVRDLKTRDIVRSVEFKGPLTHAQLRRVEAALLRKIDLDHHFLDTVVVEMLIQRRNRR